MPLRLIEVIIPEGHARSAGDLLEGETYVGIWQDRISDTLVALRILVSGENSEAVMDALDKQFSGMKDFRLILLPVEAALPRPQAEAKEESEPGKQGDRKSEEKTPSRISREELYSEISEGAALSGVYIAMVVLSAIVAAIGLLKDNVAILIGAMVLAPLLGPQIALSLATTLADASLARNALKTGLLGTIIALALAVALGYVIEVNPEIPEILSRTEVALSDAVLALAAGTAGALAYTTGLSAALIGVMVAVAILPPLVCAGLLLGSGYFSLAVQSFLLLLMNVICVNLAGVLTFLFRGIRPRTWWEADRAKKATRKAIAIWSGLLILLGAVVFLSQTG